MIHASTKACRKSEKHVTKMLEMVTHGLIFSPRFAAKMGCAIRHYKDGCGKEQWVGEGECHSRTLSIVHFTSIV
jgi:hypothetical protein